MKNAFKSNCLLCGEALVYSTESKQLTWALCGNESQSEASCSQGHYICDSCHSASANEMIESICIKSETTKPVDLAIELIKKPSTSMHGPDHHFLVPAVLLTAFYNQKGDAKEKEKKIKVARQRADTVLGGFCGFYGACGAGVGTGTFLSLIMDSTPFSTETWGLSNQMTAENLRCIGALGGPRCCKRDTIMALKTTRKFLKQQMGFALNIPDQIICTFTENNKECIKEKYPFHVKEPV